MHVHASVQRVAWVERDVQRSVRSFIALSGQLSPVASSVPVSTYCLFLKIFVMCEIEGDEADSLLFDLVFEDGDDFDFTVLQTVFIALKKY